MIKQVSIQKDGIGRIDFNKRCDFWVPLGGGDFLPLGHCRAQQAPQYLDAYGNDEVLVTFRTVDAYVEQDKRTYMRRLDKILAVCGFEKVGDDWENKVIDGHVFANDFQIKIKKA